MHLHDAAQAGDLTALRERITAGESIEARDAEGRTSLMVAAEAGCEDVLRALIEAGASVDAAADPRDPAPNEPKIEPGLREITRQGLGELIGSIIGGSMTAQAKRSKRGGPTALMAAAAAGESGSVAILLAAGAQPSLQDRDGFSALAYASASGHAGIVRALIEAGAEIDPRDHYDLTPLTLAALKGHEAAVRALTEAGADVPFANKWGYSPLHAAARYGHTGAVRALLAAGGDPNVKVLNSTPLERAMDQGHIEAVRALIEWGGDLNVRDLHGHTLLMKAVARGDVEIVRSLLAAGADPRAIVSGKGGGGLTNPLLPERASAMHVAAYQGSPEIVAALLAAGANPQARDAKGFTPLMLAGVGGQTEAARLLREAASPPEADAALLAAVDLIVAVRSGDAERVRALTCAGASPDTPTPDIGRYHQVVRSEVAGDDWYDPSCDESEGSYRDADRPVLVVAAEQGDVEVVRALIEAGADVNIQYSLAFSFGGDRTPLMAAAQKGHRAVVAALLAAGADVHAKDRGMDGGGRTSLMEAALEGHAEVIRDLIAAGAKVNIKDRSRSTPLIDAAGAGHAEVVRVLLEAGARLDPKNDFGSTALGWAAYHGHEEVVRLLLDAARSRGQKPDPSDLPQAVSSGSESIVRLLLDAGVGLDGRGSLGETALTAASREHPKLVPLLLDTAVDVNSQEDGSKSALSTAVIFGRLDAIRALLEHGADPDVKYEAIVEGETPLIRAAGIGTAEFVFEVAGQREMGRERDEAMVRLLLEHGADLEVRDDAEGRTALLHAAANGRAAMVRLLLDAGADIEARDTEHGRSALMWAAMEGHEEVVGLLIEAGADVLAESFDGQTAASLAAEPAHEKVLRRLAEAGVPTIGGSTSRELREAVRAGDLARVGAALASGASPDVRDAEGGSALADAAGAGQVEIARDLLAAGAGPRTGGDALNAAAEAGHVEMVRLLIEAGVDPDSRRESGTPLIAASSRGHLAIVRALIENGAALNTVTDAGFTALMIAAWAGHADVAKALLRAGATVDERSSPYVALLDYVQNVRQPAYQEALARLTSACGAEAEPVGRIPGAFIVPVSGSALADKWIDSSRETERGIAEMKAVEQRVVEVFEALQEDFLRLGFHLIRARSSYGHGPDVLMLLPTGDKYAVIAAIGTDACNSGMGTVQIIEKLREMERDWDQPFLLTGCQFDVIEGRFTTPIRDPDGLARWMNEFCSDIVTQGVGSVEALADELRAGPRLYFWWD